MLATFVTLTYLLEYLESESFEFSTMTLICKICCEASEFHLPIDENTKSKLALCLPEVKAAHGAVICGQCLTMLNISDVFVSICLNYNKFTEDKCSKPKCTLCRIEVTVYFGLDDQIKTKMYTCVPSLKFPVGKNLPICAQCLYMSNIMQNLKKIDRNSRENYFAAIRGGKSSIMKTKLQMMGSPTTMSTNLSKMIDNKLKTGSSHIPPEDDPDPFICDHCSRCFKTLSALKEHEKKHLGSTPVYCSICNRSFSYSSNLRRHVAVHLKEDDYHRIESLNCIRCKVPFPTLYELAHHYCSLKQEVVETKVTCKICNEAFLSEVQLTNHVNSHIE